MERQVRARFERQPSRDEEAYPSWICDRGATKDAAKDRRNWPPELMKPLLSGPMKQSIQFIASPALSLVILYLLPGESISFAAGPQDSQATPARTVIDFDHDIRPIFESSCLRCHGPERPKSRFRLDNRDSALKGGDDGVDIVPGHTDKSPLLERVASGDEDKQMPPPGKGARLTAAQIDKLRAWI